GGPEGGRAWGGGGWDPRRPFNGGGPPFLFRRGLSGQALPPARWLPWQRTDLAGVRRRHLVERAESAASGGRPGLAACCVRGPDGLPHADAAGGFGLPAPGLRRPAGDAAPDDRYL